MRKSVHLLLIVLLVSVSAIASRAQDTVRVASYNLLNYPGGTTSGRDQYFRAVVAWIQPDVLAVEEMTSQAGVDEFLANVMNAYTPGLYATVKFHDGPDTDTGIFFKPSVWDFVDTVYVPTTLRNLADYTIQHKKSGDLLHLLVVHLKASSGSANETQRLAEATILRDHLNSLPADTKFIIVGDYNIYRSSEAAFQKLLESETNNNGRAFDPLNMVGTWQDNPSFAGNFTQSTRTAAFGGGATGGLDDRFDIMLISSNLQSSIVAGSYKAVGNDGAHLNSSLDILPNGAVPDSVALGVYYGSDHLPVTARFVFNSVPLAVQLSSATATLLPEGGVQVAWITSSEVNNYGFVVETSTRLTGAYTTVSGLIPGHLTTSESHAYEFIDKAATNDSYFRLRQIDLDGTAHVSEPFTTSGVTDVREGIREGFALIGNYPNPFNPSTTISYRLAHPGPVSLVVFDYLGRAVEKTVNQWQSAGEHAAKFDGTGHASGMYIVRLSSGGSAAMMKILLVK